ncbi:MAG: hypothetical protein ACO3JL_07505 [Myxococcota bacterium]
MVSLALLPGAGCGLPLEEGFDSDHEHPLDIAQGRSEKQQRLAVSGPWMIPDEVMAVGDTQDVSFDNAPPYDGGDNCTSGPTAGALTLRDHLLAQFPQIDQIGIYNCRVIAGTNAMSLHGVGRALDIMVSTVAGDADNGAGDPIGHWLIENAELLGVQTVIWDSVIWRVSYSPRAHSYAGSNPHIDHLHVEINLEAAAQELPWYGGFAPPMACGSLPGGSQVIEESDACFQLYGPSSYWRHVSGAGSGEELYWTNAFESDAPSNWASWSLPVQTTGAYSIDVYIDEEYGLFHSVPYTISTGISTMVVHLDQSAAAGWRPLGTVQLTGNRTSAVVVGDHSPVPVGDARSIAVDALRITPLAAEQGCAPMPPEGGTLEETHPCLTLHGPASGWRSEPFAGSRGGLLWTNGFQGDDPVNWAEWTVLVTTESDYALEVYLAPEWSQFPTTHYEVTAAGSTTDLLIDASLQNGWVALGTYHLAPGEHAKVRVFDHHPGEITAARRVLVDAIRVVRAGSAQDDPAPGPGRGTYDGAPWHDGHLLPGRPPRADDVSDFVLDSDDPGTGTAAPVPAEVASCGSVQGAAPSLWPLGLVVLCLRRRYRAPNRLPAPRFEQRGAR